MHHAVHRAVGDLCGELVVEQVQRSERERCERGAGRAVAQIRGEAVAQCRHSRTNAVVGAIPTQQRAELPANREQRAHHPRRFVRRVARRHALYQEREVVGSARRRQLPHVLEPEVAGELVDPPRA
jgi:hypothetical protein